MPLVSNQTTPAELSVSLWPQLLSAIHTGTCCVRLLRAVMGWRTIQSLPSPERWEGLPSAQGSPAGISAPGVGVGLVVVIYVVLAPASIPLPLPRPHPQLF